MDERIQKAVDYAVAIANDNTHGYDQKDRWGNPNFDCSGLVITAYEQAGIPVKTNGATYTGNMKAVFLKTGFKDITSIIELKTGKNLQVGDVLLKPGSHTAIYIGNGQLVHASINEKGKVVGGKSGDQTGKEICVRSYYNKWSCVLRYMGTYTESTSKVLFRAMVTCTALNVRSAPDITKGKVIKVYKKGTIAEITGTYKNGNTIWGKCKDGWMSLNPLYTKEV